MQVEARHVPWASFCIATYRRPDFLQDTLHALLQQTMPDFEIIISDNDPAGSGRSIVDSFQDSRLRYFCNSENVGMIKNFNLALARATGDYIVMLSDDDPVYPEMLATVRRLSQEHPGYGSYYGGSDVRTTNPDIARLYGLAFGTNPATSPDVPPQAVRLYSARQFPLEFLSNGIFPYFLWSTGVVRREIALEVGGVPDYASPYLTDFGYLALALSHSGCATVNTALGCQTVHDRNFGRQEFVQLERAARGFRDAVQAHLSHRDDWNEVRPRLERFVGNWIVGHLLFLHKYLRLYNQDASLLVPSLGALFKLPFMRVYLLKYLLNAYAPGLASGLRWARSRVARWPHRPASPV